MDSDQNSGVPSQDGKPINGKVNFWNRFTAIEHGVDELQRCRLEMVIESMVRVVDALIEALEVLSRPSEKPKATHERPEFHVEVVRWPPAFARTLIDGGVKCDESRREAVRRYVEVLDDLQRHETQLAKASEDQQQAWQDTVTRWRRQLTYQHDTLLNLDVTVNANLIGSRFDPLLHEIAGTAATPTESDVDTIAEVKRPLFSWKDGNGTPQCVPALVVLYAVE